MQILFFIMPVHVGRGDNEAIFHNVIKDRPIGKVSLLKFSLGIEETSVRHSFCFSDVLKFLILFLDFSKLLE